MKLENIYIGNIMKFMSSDNNSFINQLKQEEKKDNNKESIEKKDVFLIKIGKDRYVDFDDIENVFEYLYLLITARINSKVLTTNATNNNQLYVDKNSIKPYSKIKNDNQSIKENVKVKVKANR